ncbi:hypothetical protein PybrP1_006657 [[Pythium] brassicae (nom. inval.)]|nr:hypothetical protein PybrP1_006657 [[Pythium] brassicae (nom. inval.)]
MTVSRRVIEGGHLNVLQRLYPLPKASPNDHANLLLGATIHGHLNIVRWLHEHQCRRGAHPTLAQTPCGRLVLARAIQRGHFAVARYLDERGFPFDEAEGALAALWASTGYLEMLAHDTFLDDEPGVHAMGRAAGNVHLEWLHANRAEGCTHLAMERAAYRGDLETLLFLKANGLDQFTMAAVERAMAGMQFEVYEWLCKNYPNAKPVGSTSDPDALNA